MLLLLGCLTQTLSQAVAVLPDIINEHIEYQFQVIFKSVFFYDGVADVPGSLMQLFCDFVLLLGLIEMVGVAH